MNSAEEVWKRICDEYCGDVIEPARSKYIGYIQAYAEERVKEASEENQKEIDELTEPMSCGHTEAEMQPSDEGPDMCIACYLQRGAVEEARAEALEEAAKLCVAIEKICDKSISILPALCAEKIRALKGER
jgi:hypothetical protein